LLHLLYCFVETFDKFAASIDDTGGKSANDDTSCTGGTNLPPVSLMNLDLEISLQICEKN
jgi:hypothetical protein